MSSKRLAILKSEKKIINSKSLESTTKLFFFSLERVVPPIPDLGEKKNRKRCCAITNVFFPLVKLPCHEDKDADVDNTRLRARQQMWCNYGMMYQALKLPHHLHDYRSDRVRKRTDEEISSAFLWREKKREEKKRGEEEEGKKGALVMSAGETLENVDFSFEELDEHDGFDVKEFYYSTICE